MAGHSGDNCKGTADKGDWFQNRKKSKKFCKQDQPPRTIRRREKVRNRYA